MTRWILSAAVLFALTAAVNRAEAGFQVTFWVDGANTTIVDGGAGDLDGTANSIINVSTTVGGYTFTTTLATTNTPGGPNLAFINVGTGSIQGTGAATIRVYASANGFTMPASPPDVIVNSGSTFQWLSPSQNGDSADHSFAAYYDSSNALSTSASGTLIGSDTAGGITAGAMNDNSALGDLETHTFNTTPYSLNLELVAVLSGSGLHTLDLDGEVEVAPVPEPASLAGWAGLALLGCAAAARRRRRARQAGSDMNG